MTATENDNQFVELAQATARCPQVRDSSGRSLPDTHHCYGRVVEEGTWTVLIARDSPFARLVEAGLAGEASDGPDAPDGL